MKDGCRSVLGEARTNLVRRLTDEERRRLAVAEAEWTERLRPLTEAMERSRKVDETDLRITITSPEPR